MTTTEAPDTAVCTCSPDSGCDGEGFEPDDDRTCQFCLALDGEVGCPADPVDYEEEVESLAALLKQQTTFEPVIVCADGSEPFASLDLGHGLVLDLTAQVRRAGLDGGDRDG